MKKKISIIIRENSFEVIPGETILEAATRNEIFINSSCREGSCGACRTKVLRGTVEQQVVKRFGLTDEEKSQNYIHVLHFHFLTWK